MDEEDYSLERPAASAAGADPYPRRGAVLLVTAVGAFTTPFLTSAVNIALPAIQRNFHLTTVTLSWVSLIYLIGLAASLVPFAKVADLIGRKRLYMWSWPVMAVGSLGAALAPNAWFLLCSRVVQAVGAGMSFSTGPAILTAAFPPDERGKVLGLNSAATYVGLALGPVLGGLLAERLGWRSIFIVMAGLAVVTFAVGMSRLQGLEWHGERRGRFDVLGTLLYMVGLSCLLLGLSLLPQAVGALLVVVGVAGTGLFAWWETRAEDPLFAMGLFVRNRVFALSNLAALINYSATYAVSFMLSLFLQYLGGLTAERAGLVLLAGTVVQAAFSPAAGRLSDRLEPRFVASFGMALCAAGLMGLLFVGQGTPVWVVAAVQCLLGVGFAFFVAPNTSTIMGSAGWRHLGAAAASVAVMRSTGMGFSMGVTALVLGLTVGRGELTPVDYPAFLVGMRITLTIFVVLCLVGVVASLARGKVQRTLS